MENRDVIIVGAGLAGLSAGLRLAEQGRKVTLLEAKAQVGGRTSSWSDKGMPVESGLHRFLGFYTRLPKLMRDAGIDLDKSLIWEDEAELRIPDGPRKLYGASFVRKPGLTIKGLVTTKIVRSVKDNVALGIFFICGLIAYVFRPGKLDTYTVYELAKKHHVSDLAIERVLVPLTEGIFFIRPDKYSAFVFFALMAKGVARPHRLGIAAFAGGMTEVMAAPIADRITALGGEVRVNAAVNRLVVEDGRVCGVEADGNILKAKEVIVAVSLAPAQRLIRQAFGVQEWNKDMLELPSMPAATLQAELNAPSVEVDRTTFAPGTCLSTYSEQSRTTFTHAAGRISIILSYPERRLTMEPAAILEEAQEDSERIGVALKGNVRDYRVINHPDDFYALTPNSEKLRPFQETPVPGLTLAGDYTKQNFLATMEGAVISGEIAAKIVDKRLAH